MGREEGKNAIDLLVRFGLSEDEASLFVFLSRLNKGTTKWIKGVDVSSLFKKGRVRTYQILGRLLELGLAKADFSRPKRYSAVSPQLALRRLLAVHESKLTELSHLEKSAIESVLDLTPIQTAFEERNGDSKPASDVTLLQGLANIQVTLREAMEGADLLVITNEESIDHVVSLTQYLANKPKRMRLVFACPSRSLLRRYRRTISENDVSAKWFRESWPSILVSGDQVILLFYTTRKVREKPLSPLTVSSNVSQIAVVDNRKYAQEMSECFELLWRNSESMIH